MLATKSKRSLIVLHRLHEFDYDMDYLCNDVPKQANNLSMDQNECWKLLEGHDSDMNTNNQLLFFSSLFPNTTIWQQQQWKIIKNLHDRFLSLLGYSLSHRSLINYSYTVFYLLLITLSVFLFFSLQQIYPIVSLIYLNDIYQ